MTWRLHESLTHSLRIAQLGATENGQAVIILFFVLPGCIRAQTERPKELYYIGLLCSVKHCITLQSVMS